MSEPYNLQHHVADCIGNWSLVGRSGRARWQCSQCGSSYDDGPEVFWAAIMEEAMGEILRRLTRAGEELRFRDD